MRETLSMVTLIGYFDWLLWLLIKNDFWLNRFYPALLYHMGHYLPASLTAPPPPLPPLPSRPYRFPILWCHAIKMKFYGVNYKQIFSQSIKTTTTYFWTKYLGNFGIKVLNWSCMCVRPELYRFVVESRNRFHTHNQKLCHCAHFRPLQLTQSFSCLLLLASPCFLGFCFSY